jgi:HAD superfamily hydrolase (TIGR01509 family)
MVNSNRVQKIISTLFQKNMIKAAIFDMDGLMFDTESAYSIVQTKMFARRGMVFTNDIKRTLMGKRAREVMESLNELWGRNEHVEELLEEQDKELICVYKESVEKLKGLDTILVFLEKEKIRKCIGTSSRKFLVDILFEKFDMGREFEFVVTGDEVKKGKPDPEIYIACVSRLGVFPDECIVFEDSLNGIKAARGAGCKTCAIPSEYTKEEDFSIADIVCNSLEDPAIRNFITSVTSVK